MRKKKKLKDCSTELISKSDRMKRLAACCGIAGFLLACLAALLNYRQYLETWQVKLLAAILITSIIIILAYCSLWVWIYNRYQKSKGK